MPMLLSLINTLYETFYIIYIANVWSNAKLSKMRIVIFTAIMSAGVFISGYKLILSNHLLYDMLWSIFIISIAFRKQLSEVLTYFFIENIYMIFVNMIFILINQIVFKGNTINAIQMITYSCLEWMALTAAILNSKRLKTLANKLINKYVLSLILIIFIAFMCFMLLTPIFQKDMNNEVRICVICICSAIFILASAYFVEIHYKSLENQNINKILSEKNEQLRIIKHDYATQINCLYMLYSMGKYGELGDMFSKIINIDNNVSAAIEICDYENPILLTTLEPAKKSDINIIVDGGELLDKVNMVAFDLATVISNIINNAIRALDGVKNAVLKIHIIELENNISISISNNGPQIPHSVAKQIFEKGFTTKDDNDKDHGYGLHIVKETIERNGGKISVKSKEDLTTFKIIISKKNNDNNEE